MAEKKADGKPVSPEENKRKSRPYKNVFGVNPGNLYGLCEGTKLSGYKTLFKLHSVEHRESGESPDQPESV